MICQTDDRIGGVPEYYLGERDLMRIPDEVLKCVGFVGFKKLDNSIRICGTSFFVSIPKDDPDKSDLFVVTARHVIDHIKKEACNSEVRIRVNTKNSGTIDAISSLSDWKTHSADQSIDVAVCRWEPPLGADFKYVPRKMFRDEKRAKDSKVYAGDEVFLTGMYKHHRGDVRNSPIVRTGTVAMMPDEPVLIDTAKGEKSISYLIETRSLGGLSGSPVFVAIQPEFSADSTRIRQSRRGAMFLFGLARGHFNLDKIDPHSDSINSGIAIVVPAQKILETIDDAMAI